MYSPGDRSCKCKPVKVEVYLKSWFFKITAELSGGGMRDKWIDNDSGGGPIKYQMPNGAVVYQSRIGRGFKLVL